MNEATKIQLALKREQDKTFKAKFLKVLYKIQALKEPAKTRQNLCIDLQGCNSEDLMDVLVNDTFKSELDFIATVNAFLDLEAKAYEYPVTLKYEVGKLKQITDFIVLFHKQYELKKQIERL